ncbi:MAG: GNAT family N-acetyltransferase [Acidimicrobiia bacterium]|nr:GNAT family N-acetyltransferase [Acidimicrobiia bacterium]
MSEVTIGVEDPTTDDAQWCLRQYFAELSRLFETGYDPDSDAGFDVSEFQGPDGAMMIIRNGRDPIGCGAVRVFDAGRAEIKRMWIYDNHRGKGLATRLLSTLEQWAIDRGLERVVLDTNSALTTAIAMYQAKGYVEIDRYNDGPYPDRWFEKRLAN